MSDKIKIEPSLTNRKSISVAKKMGKKYTLADAIMVGKKLGINWNKVDFKPSDLLVGMHYELEHGKIDARTNVTGDSRIKTAKVAWAHLVERPDYYVQLMKIDPPESPEKKKKHIEDDIKKMQEKKAMELNLRLSKEASYLSKKDIDKSHSFKNGKDNLLYITGLSGSGKSTLGEKLEQKLPATLIELDGFEHGYDSTNKGIVREYLKNHPKINSENINAEMPKILKYIEGVSSKNPNEKYIAEGIQLLDFPQYMKQHPHIVKGTGVIKSSFRSAKRDGSKLGVKIKLNKELNPKLNSLFKQASYLRDIKCEVCGYQGKPNGKGQCPTCFAIMGKKGRELPIPPKDIQPVSNGRSVEEDAIINAYEENLTAY